MAFSFRFAAISVGKHIKIPPLPVPEYHFRRYSNRFSSNTWNLSSSSQKQRGNEFSSIRATKIDGIARSSDLIAPKAENHEEQPASGNWKIKMLYDGECPLCMREVDMLRQRNQSFGTIKFVDISSEDFSPEENQGLDYKTVMGRIHAILSDGTVVTDIEAFRRLYEAVGLGWVYAVTKYEPFATIADALYGVWAKYRLQITGRPPLKKVLEARKNKRELCNDKSTCKI